MTLLLVLHALLVTAAVQLACSAARSEDANTLIAELSDADLSSLLKTSEQSPSAGELQPNRRPLPVTGLKRLPSFVEDFRPTSNQGGRCPARQDCVSIRDCPAYRTREDIIRNRPIPCGFSGDIPLICCDREEPGTLTRAPELPQNCGLHGVDLVSDETRRGRRQTAARLRRKSPLDLKPHTITKTPLDGRFSEMTPISAVGGTRVPLSTRPGGRQVHRWPWIVLFGRWTDTGLGEWFCGGTLITAQHVLTAAHCLHPDEAGAVGARIADHDLRLPSEVQHQERNVSRIVRHPQYVVHDLAVVRLSEPVEFTESVQPICLPAAGAEHIGQDVDVAGWGLLEFNGAAADVLQEVPLRVTDHQACEAAYRRLPLFASRFPGGFQGSKLCAESRDGKPRDACRGDSGGPLMALSPGGRYQLVGVVSTGFGCGNPQFPGLYTKVSAYIDWIISQLN